jgi:hypothetical protein
LEQLHDLLRQHDDLAGHHVLWVRKDGEVMLTCLPNEMPYRVPTYEHPDMQMRYDTFPVAHEYVGQEATEDQWWTTELFKNMQARWAGAKGTAGVTHIDLDTVAPDGRPVDAEEAAWLKREREEFLRRKQAGELGRCPVEFVEKHGGKKARMNLNDNATLAQFREMLRQHDDGAGNHALWVRKDGEVMLTCLPRDDYKKVPPYTHRDMQMRYDLFPAGYEYVGAEAAEEDWWIPLLFENMLELWGKVKGIRGVTHIDLDTVAPDGRPVDAEEAAWLKRQREAYLRRKQAGELGRCPASVPEQEGRACPSS